ncbi:MAG: OB-fold nucleic acid binding domain-containing protein, partial [Vulcanimicrobiaceae bacterium]
MSDLVAARRARLAALRERGVDPFTATRYDVTAHAADLAARYASLGEQGRDDENRWSLAGRLMSVRAQGGVVFADVHDRTGRFQLFVRRNDIGDEQFGLFKELERGDLIGATGTVFRTKMGELSLAVADFAVLGKSLRPLPDKWHGLVDVEKRYR